MEISDGVVAEPDIRIMESMLVEAEPACHKRKRSNIARPQHIRCGFVPQRISFCLCRFALAVYLYHSTQKKASVDHWIIVGPPKDFWQIRVLDPGFAVVDAALAVQQPRFVQDLEMGNPSLSWMQSPQMGEVSNVQVEVSFLRRVKDVKAILVSLPENYRHDIQHKNQLRNVNKQFPLTIDTEWRVFDNLRYIKVLVEVAETGEAQIIIAGTYQWQFPVMVPLIKPFASEWYVSLCSEQTCTEVGDPGIMVSFPVPNNEPQMPAKVFQVVSTTGASSRSRISCMILVILFLTIVPQKIAQ